MSLDKSLKEYFLLTHVTICRVSKTDRFQLQKVCPKRPKIAPEHLISSSDLLPPVFSSHRYNKPRNVFLNHKQRMCT